MYRVKFISSLSVFLNDLCGIRVTHTLKKNKKPDLNGSSAINIKTNAEFSSVTTKSYNSKALLGFQHDIKNLTEKFKTAQEIIKDSDLKSCGNFKSQIFLQENQYTANQKSLTPKRIRLYS